MPLPLVTQLRFARSEFMRCLQGVSPEDAVRRILPMNCISWTVGHLASQENQFWVYKAQGVSLYPELRKLVGFGRPASTPPYAEMLQAWQEITRAADTYLESLSLETLTTFFPGADESVGTLLQRNLYHYFFHTGESHAVRQVLGHPDLPQFIGDMDQAIYRPN